jgi:hypothetical protein
MLDFIIHILAFFITIPIVASFLVYIGSMIRERNKWKAIRRMVNWTTVFYIIATAIMLSLLFEREFIGVIIIFLLIGQSVIIFIQWKNERDIEFTKGFKLLWRISFLVFFFLYGCLMLVGILMRLTT